MYLLIMFLETYRYSCKQRIMLLEFMLFSRDV